MTITLHWWYLVIGLIIFPMIIGFFRDEPRNFFGLDFLLTFLYIGSWCLSIGILIGHFL